MVRCVSMSVFFFFEGGEGLREAAVGGELRRVLFPSGRGREQEGRAGKEAGGAKRATASPAAATGSIRSDAAVRAPLRVDAPRDDAPDNGNRVPTCQRIYRRMLSEIPTRPLSYGDQCEPIAPGAAPLWP